MCLLLRFVVGGMEKRYFQIEIFPKSQSESPFPLLFSFLLFSSLSPPILTSPSKAPMKIAKGFNIMPSIYEDCGKTRMLLGIASGPTELELPGGAHLHGQVKEGRRLGQKPQTSSLTMEIRRGRSDWFI